MNTAAGWYPDPGGSDDVRYWDGSKWAQVTVPRSQFKSDPLAGHVLGATPAAPDPTSPSTGIALTGKGVTGRLHVDQTFVTISRKGAMAKMSYGWTRGEKRIPIDSITAVQFKAPRLTNGYIQFTLGGGSESRRGVLDATKDENSVLFSASHAREFAAIRDHIESRIANRLQQPGSAIDVSPKPDVATQLREFARLRDEGVLTEEEFIVQKQRLLNGM